MKKIIFISLLIPGICFVSFSQTPYYDALSLGKIGVLFENKITFRESDTALISEILRKYAPDEIYYSGLVSAFQSNPFIELPKNTNQTSDNPGSISRFSNKRSVLSTVGGLDVTTIADGLARFIVDRAKKELNAFFFESFRDRLETITELQVLFPNTAQQLRIIGSEIYNYNAYIISLRETFEKDLSALFVNLPKLMDNSKYEKAFDDFPLFRVTLKSSFYIVTQLNNKAHPGDIIHEFPQQFGKDPIPENFYNLVKVLDLFSQSVRSKDKNKYWIEADSLGLLLNPVTFRIFLGLVYQTTPDQIVFRTAEETFNFKSEILEKAGQYWNDEFYIQYKNYIMGLGSKADIVHIALKGIPGKSKDGKAPYKEIYSFISASLAFFDHIIAFRNLPYVQQNLKDSEFFNYCFQYSFALKQGNELYLNVNSRDYGAGILNVINIFDTIFTEKILRRTANNIVKSNLSAISTKISEFEEEKVKMDQQIRVVKDDKQIKILTNHSEDFAKQAEKLKKEEEKLKKEEGKNSDNYYRTLKLSRQYILKYGTFMVNIVGAKSSEEVESIIESVALPAGSSRIKRESRFNVSLNSYLGLFLGHEFIQGVSNWPVINNYAVSAPVGVSFTWGGLKCKPKSSGWGLGGFVSIIDLGALASFRITDDTTAAVAPTVELQDIIAPGAFITLNFPKSPLSVAVGAQVGPLLRKVTTNEKIAAKNAYWRIGLTLTVDIPLFNLYNREKPIR